MTSLDILTPPARHCRAAMCCTHGAVSNCDQLRRLSSQDLCENRLCKDGAQSVGRGSIHYLAKRKREKSKRQRVTKWKEADLKSPSLDNGQAYDDKASCMLDVIVYAEMLNSGNLHAPPDWLHIWCFMPIVARASTTVESTGGQNAWSMKSCAVWKTSSKIYSLQRKKWAPGKKQHLMSSKAFYVPQAKFPRLSVPSDGHSSQRGSFVLLPSRIVCKSSITQKGYCKESRFPKEQTNKPAGKQADKKTARRQTNWLIDRNEQKLTNWTS